MKENKRYYPENIRGISLPSKRILIILLIIYIVFVGIFSGIYNCMWICNPDNFIVQKEFNLFPITELREMNNIYGINGYIAPPNNDDFSLDEISSTTDELKEK